MYCLITQNITLEEVNIKDNIKRARPFSNMKTQRSLWSIPHSKYEKENYTGISLFYLKDKKDLYLISFLNHT